MLEETAATENDRLVDQDGTSQEPWCCFFRTKACFVGLVTIPTAAASVVCAVMASLVPGHVWQITVPWAIGSLAAAGVSALSLSKVCETNGCGRT
ncbi:MAG TPA: hypothetical protein VGV92_03735 [Gammaproteobacteria bacterium]|nr:hypothetical protein [Gammaproteobacteria bacterium]